MNRRLQARSGGPFEASRAAAEVLRVLLVEDSERDAELMVHELQRASIEHESRRVQTEADFKRELEAFRPQVILADFAMPYFSGTGALEIWRRSGLDIPFIFVSGTIGEDVAVEAMKAGAHDYVMKTNLARLVPAIRRELREAELRRASQVAEAGLRRAQEMARLAHIITAPDGAFESWSDTLPQLIGRPAAEVPASTRKWLELLHADDRKRFRDTAVAAARGQERSDVEYRLRRPDGTWIHVHQTMEPLDGERDLSNGSRWFNTLQDVSAQKSAEETERRFRLALDSSADMLVIIDRTSMRFVDVNRSACMLLGYTREELLSMGPHDILPVSREELERRYDELIASPALATGMNSHYLCKDGSRLPFESTRRALRSGDRWFIVAISRDIRERLAAEQALRESSGRQSAILASSLDALVSIDHHGRIIEFNPAAEAMFGLSRDAALGKSIAETIIPPRYREAHRRGFAHYLATGEGPVLGKRIEIEAVRADGTEFPVELSITPIKAGAAPLFTAFIRDITERKAAEARIRRLNRVYAVLSGINSLIVHARDREELYREACRIAVEAGGLRLAWIGIVDPAKEEVVPAAFSGVEEGWLGIIRLSTTVDSGGFGMAGRALRDRAPIVSNDLLADEQAAFRRQSAERGYRSLAMIPLIVDGEAFGVLGLHAAEVGFFDQDEMKLLMELAGDIAFGAKHIEQGKKVQQLSRVEAIRSGINALIARAHDREELFRGSCRIAVDAGRLRLAWIGIVDRNREEVVPAAFSGHEDGLLGAIRLSTKEDSGRFGMAGRAIRDRVPSVVNDVVADQRLRGESARRGFRSFAMIPLIADGGAFGVLGLHAAEARFFNEDELRLLTELAGDITFGLKHIEQAEKVRHLTRVQAVLSGINALIVRVRDRDELLQEACRIAVEEGRFPKAWIGVIERESRRMRMVAAQGADERFFENLQAMLEKDIAEGQGVVSQTLRERRPVIANDIEHDPRVLGRENAAATGSRSLVVLPLMVAQEVAGVLVLHAGSVGFFDDEEMKLLGELAGDIAFAIEHIAKSEKLDYLAYYDALTGLANRTLFIERLEQQIGAAQKARQTLALFLLDLERFKAINDAFGRQAGDGLLKQIAARMLRTGVDPSRLARIGADTFAIMSFDMQSEAQVARRTESRLTELFGPPFDVAGKELRISGRVGIALFPNDGADAESLFHNAEAALKKAKASGERYLFHTEELTARVAERLSLETKLRQALEREEFVLHYQPKVDAAGGAIVGVEALIRWRSPELGLVPPGRFIPLLEQTGLILPVGIWALRRASLDHRSWVERKLKAPRIAVNVSPLQLRQRDFVDAVEDAIMDGVAPVGIDLEITESLVMENVLGTIEKLKAVRALGIQIAIDDFGTGYSSLGYLARLPVQTLKIDRSFIISMNDDANAMTLISTIISLAHSLRLKVVAEGVETEDQAKFLRLLRCDELQGYLFSKPVPADELERLLPGAAL